MPTRTYKKLLEGNERFVAEALSSDPDFFGKLEHTQKPKVLWIGCSDSRVPANQITNTLPGEIFVHRNVANVVVHTDMNCLSVLEYAVSVLNVEHVIVCGHYNCGGVLAAMSNSYHGAIDNWLRHIKDVYRLHAAELDAIEDPRERGRRFVEFNVIEQVLNVCKTSTIQKAWQDGPLPHVHGWVYDLGNGVIKDLDVNIAGVDDLARIYRFEL
ncbi:MAG: carbonic anhydrase [Vulcanimicrobiota bacterium]